MHFFLLLVLGSEVPPSQSTEAGKHSCYNCIVSELVSWYSGCRRGRRSAWLHIRCSTLRASWRFSLWLSSLNISAQPQAKPHVLNTKTKQQMRVGFLFPSRPIYNMTKFYESKRACGNMADLYESKRALLQASMMVRFAAIWHIQRYIHILTMDEMMTVRHLWRQKLKSKMARNLCFAL